MSNRIKTPGDLRSDWSDERYTKALAIVSKRILARGEGGYDNWTWAELDELRAESLDAFELFDAQSQIFIRSLFN